MKSKVSLNIGQSIPTMEEIEFEIDDFDGKIYLEDLIHNFNESSLTEGEND